MKEAMICKYTFLFYYYCCDVVMQQVFVQFTRRVLQINKQKYALLTKSLAMRNKSNQQTLFLFMKWNNSNNKECWKSRHFDDVFRGRCRKKFISNLSTVKKLSSGFFFFKKKTTLIFIILINSGLVFPKLSKQLTKIIITYVTQVTLWVNKWNKWLSK